MLSNRQQIARLRHLAVQALGAYPLVAPELRFVAHGEITTFRVDAMVAGGPDRFLLRVRVDLSEVLGHVGHSLDTLLGD